MIRIKFLDRPRDKTDPPVVVFLRRWSDKRWDDLSSILKMLEEQNIKTSKHSLRYLLRDLLDDGDIELEPDPRFEPLL